MHAHYWHLLSFGTQYQSLDLCQRCFARSRSVEIVDIPRVALARRTSCYSIWICLARCTGICIGNWIFEGAGGTRLALVWSCIPISSIAQTGVCIICKPSQRRHFLIYGHILWCVLVALYTFIFMTCTCMFVLYIRMCEWARLARYNPSARYFNCYLTSGTSYTSYVSTPTTIKRSVRTNTTISTRKILCESSNGTIQTTVPVITIPGHFACITTW